MCTMCVQMCVWRVEIQLVEKSLQHQRYACRNCTECCVAGTQDALFHGVMET
jgi:MinD superfamily P-loop ATPase